MHNDFLVLMLSTAPLRPTRGCSNDGSIGTTKNIDCIVTKRPEHTGIADGKNN